MLERFVSVWFLRGVFRRGSGWLIPHFPVYDAQNFEGVDDPAHFNFLLFLDSMQLRFGSVGQDGRLLLWEYDTNAKKNASSRRDSMGLYIKRE